MFKAWTRDVLFFWGRRESQFYTETNWTLSKGTCAPMYTFNCMHALMIWSFEISLLGIESFILTLVYPQVLTRCRWSFSPLPPPFPCPNSCCMFPTGTVCLNHFRPWTLVQEAEMAFHCVSDLVMWQEVIRRTWHSRGLCFPCHFSLQPNPVKRWESPSKNCPAGKKSQSSGGYPKILFWLLGLISPISLISQMYFLLTLRPGTESWRQALMSANFPYRLHHAAT